MAAFANVKPTIPFAVMDGREAHVGADMKQIILFALLLLIGCERDVYLNDASSQVKSEPEYTTGLSEIMELSPTVYASNVLTRFYNLGYSTGKAEFYDGITKGTWYAKGLSIATEKGVETGDSTITLMLTTTYKRGYQMGYEHASRHPEER